MHNKQLAACTAGVLIMRQLVTDPSAYPKYDILVTLCRFDSIRACAVKTGPFIPCERRLSDMENLRIQGRDFEPVFETGSMAGLMTLFSRHSLEWTNFRIYNPESRLIGPGRHI